jgi:hypothetical protein
VSNSPGYVRKGIMTNQRPHIVAQMAKHEMGGSIKHCDICGAKTYKAKYKERCDECHSPFRIDYKKRRAHK